MNIKGVNFYGSRHARDHTTQGVGKPNPRIQWSHGKIQLLGALDAVSHLLRIGRRTVDNSQIVISCFQCGIRRSIEENTLCVGIQIETQPVGIGQGRQGSALDPKIQIECFVTHEVVQHKRNLGRIRIHSKSIVIDFLVKTLLIDRDGIGCPEIVGENHYRWLIGLQAGTEGKGKFIGLLIQQREKPPPRQHG